MSSLSQNTSDLSATYKCAFIDWQTVKISPMSELMHWSLVSRSCGYGCNMARICSVTYCGTWGRTTEPYSLLTSPSTTVITLNCVTKKDWWTKKLRLTINNLAVYHLERHQTDERDMGRRLSPGNGQRNMEGTDCDMHWTVKIKHILLENSNIWIQKIQNPIDCSLSRLWSNIGADYFYTLFLWCTLRRILLLIYSILWVFIFFSNTPFFEMSKVTISNKVLLNCSKLLL